jgi:hypothetical protein
MKKNNIVKQLASVSVVCMLGLSAPANADTFADALRATYANNPEIKAQRQSLQAADELVSQANFADSQWDV